MNIPTYELAVIGAGPIGVEAAVKAYQSDRDFTVFEKSKIGNHLLQWNQVELFTPFEMNRSDDALRLAEKNNINTPESDTYHTGNDYVNEWLKPLVTNTDLNDHFNTGVTVESISRETQLKGENIGSNERKASPFRIVTDDQPDSVIHAQTVIDASGTFGQPNPLGAGGSKAPGEQVVQDRIERGFPDVEDLSNFAGKDILLVGAGYSAATNLLRLNEIQDEHPKTNIHWAIRSSKTPPIARIEEDPLPARDRLAQKANTIAENNHINIRSNVEIHRLSDRAGEVEVEFTDGSTLRVDQIISNVGYRPDRSIYRELQFHECYGTEGPIDLAASLLDQDGADCLDVDPGGTEVLETPEPNFFVVGSKSYGRNSNFLLETGLEQLRDLFESDILFQ